MDKLELIEKIESFRNFKNNWNGYGAKPISKNVINRAMILAYDFEPMQEVFPTANNSIQFEWDMNGVYIELEVFEDNIKVFGLINE